MVLQLWCHLNSKKKYVLLIQLQLYWWLIQNSPPDPYHRDNMKCFSKYDISNEKLVILINDDIIDIKPPNVLRRYKALLGYC